MKLSINPIPQFPSKFHISKYQIFQTLVKFCKTLALQIFGDTLTKISNTSVKTNKQFSAKAKISSKETLMCSKTGCDKTNYVN